MMRKHDKLPNWAAMGRAIVLGLVAMGFNATAIRAEAVKACGPVTTVPACASVKLVPPVPACAPVKQLPPVHACAPVKFAPPVSACAPVKFAPPAACEPVKTYGVAPVSWTEGHVARLIHSIGHHHHNHYFYAPTVSESLQPAGVPTAAGPAPAAPQPPAPPAKG